MESDTQIISALAIPSTPHAVFRDGYKFYQVCDYTVEHNLSPHEYSYRIEYNEMPDCCKAIYSDIETIPSSDGGTRISTIKNKYYFEMAPHTGYDPIANKLVNIIDNIFNEANVCDGPNLTIKNSLKLTAFITHCEPVLISRLARSSNRIALAYHVCVGEYTVVGVCDISNTPACYGVSVYINKHPIHKGVHEYREVCSYESSLLTSSIRDEQFCTSIMSRNVSSDMVAMADIVSNNIMLWYTFVSSTDPNIPVDGVVSYITNKVLDKKLSSPGGDNMYTDSIMSFDSSYILKPIVVVSSPLSYGTSVSSYVFWPMWNNCIISAQSINEAIALLLQNVCDGRLTFNKFLLFMATLSNGNIARFTSQRRVSSSGLILTTDINNIVQVSGTSVCGTNFLVASHADVYNELLGYKDSISASNTIGDTFSLSVLIGNGADTSFNDGVDVVLDTHVHLTHKELNYSSRGYARNLNGARFTWGQTNVPIIESHTAPRRAGELC